MEPLIQKPDLVHAHSLLPGRGGLAIAGDWALIVTAFTAATVFPNSLVFLAAFIVITRQQHALLVLMHEAAHRRLFRRSWSNDTLGQVFTASPLFFSLDGYRYLHLRHHAHPLTAEDPDLPLNGGYPISRASFRRKLVRDLTGQTYLKAVGYFTFTPPEERRSRYAAMQRPWLVGIVMNALLFAALMEAGRPSYYFTLWLLPAITVLQAVLRLRGVAEHSGLAPNADQRFATRTVGRSWQSWLLAPHAVNFHVEHHLYPGVPFYRLAELHEKFRAAGAIPPTSYATNYTEVVRQIVVPDAAKP